MGFKIIFPKIFIVLIILLCAQWSGANNLTYSTFLGSSDGDYGYAIAVDTGGNAYITGLSYSTTFPTTSGAYDTTADIGYAMVFISKINSSGSALIYSTFLGPGIGRSIAVDSEGNVFITGETGGYGLFPTTPGAYDTTFNGGLRDVFVTKLNSSGSTLIYSTFIGGTNDDYGRDLVVDAAGNAYVTGYTKSNNFPRTVDSFDSTFNGGTEDTFISKLNSNGSGLDYSTYLGGSGDEEPYAIALDLSNNAYVTGFTDSYNFPVTPIAFSTSFNGGTSDIFVSKINSSGSGLDYSTYLGGSGDDVGFGIAVNIAGEAFITGYSTSTDYPVLAGCYDTTYNGKGGWNWGDAIITELHYLGSALVYSTFLGGIYDDSGNCIALDSVDNIYVMGNTFSPDFPVTSNAYDSTLAYSGDIFITKINSNYTTLIYSSHLGGDAWTNYGRGMALDGAGFVFLTGETLSSDFPITPGALDTTFGGNNSDDIFVTKLYPDSLAPMLDWMFYSDFPTLKSKDVSQDFK